MSGMLLPAKTAQDMVVHHAGGLHEGVADRGAHETEATALELLAHRLGLGRLQGNLLEGLPMVDLGSAARPEARLLGSHIQT